MFIAHHAVKTHFIGQGRLLVILVVEHVGFRRIKVGVEKAQATRIVRFQIRVRDVGIRLLRKPIDFDLMHDLVIGLFVNRYKFGLPV